MILTDNRQNIVEVTEELISVIENLVEHALVEEKLSMDYEISIIFVDNESIREINREFRDLDKATDVLSFPMLSYPDGKVFKDVYENYAFDSSDLCDGRLILGDIALSFERALEQSVDYGHSFLREVTYLIIHSILHLLGYDHMEQNEKADMRAREEYILEKFNLIRD